jgi:hypothetical protein
LVVPKRLELGADAVFPKILLEVLAGLAPKREGVVEVVEGLLVVPNDDVVFGASVMPSMGLAPNRVELWVKGVVEGSDGLLGAPKGLAAGLGASAVFGCSVGFA